MKPSTLTDTKPLSAYGQFYIGKTKRPLENRTKGQSHTKKGVTTQSDIAEHAWINHQKILGEEAMILLKHWLQRKFKEAAYIMQQSAFSQPSVDINNIWRWLLAKISKLQLTWSHIGDYLMYSSYKARSLNFTSSNFVIHTKIKKQSGIVERTWINHQKILWEETMILQKEEH